MRKQNSPPSLVPEGLRDVIPTSPESARCSCSVPEGLRSVSTALNCRGNPAANGLLSAEDRHELVVSGIPVEVVRKEIKNLHLAVYPPNGHVRVAVPLRIDDEAVRLAVITRLGWIRRRQAEFARQERQSRREMVSGESHYVWGRRYRLHVIETSGRQTISIAHQRMLELRVQPGTGQQKRCILLHRWYRRQLRAAIPPLIAKWEPILGVTVNDWRIRAMKLRWGSCKVATGRIWLNLELAKKPPQCLEYILVHEMIHLLERLHTDRFRALMDRHLPNWESLRAELNRAPLKHEDWDY